MPKKSIDELIRQIDTLRGLLQNGQDPAADEQQYLRSHLEMLLKDLDLNVKRKSH